ncbi:tRNA (adenine(58)-N(1))-methyltransferase non-catalytic subunit trm6 [Geranomyces michiganensis]|nr:tRNA (adenine(58)-N(1))-methyltransferase non-catalytic subunit trm6 [Geranomyces michiganensis]
MPSTQTPASPLPTEIELAPSSAMNAVDANDAASLAGRSSVVDDGAIMRDGAWTIVHLPSEITRLVKLSADSNVFMGKFGAFWAKALMGMPFDMPFEADAEGAVTPAPQGYSLDDFDIETEEGANNKNLFDKSDSQKLSHAEIEALKEKARTGDLESLGVIKALTENSETWKDKTEFAKAKYIKRKQKKYSRIFTPKRPTARLLCEHFNRENPRRIFEMRSDTLSQIVTAANVRAGGRYLLVDEAGGILSCALAERMQGWGTIMLMHEHPASNLQMIKYLNFPPEVPDVMHTTLSWNRIEPQKDEDINNTDMSNADPERAERYHSRISKIKASREYLKAGGFDALIVASLFDVKEIIEVLSPYLAGSAPIVAYSQYKESLVDSWQYMRNSREFVNSQLTESWLREYQVTGGMHPTMRMSGTGGYLVSGIKVFDVEAHATAKPRAPGTGKGKGRRKRDDDDDGGEERGADKTMKTKQ